MLWSSLLADSWWSRNDRLAIACPWTDWVAQFLMHAQGSVHRRLGTPLALRSITR